MSARRAWMAGLLLALVIVVSVGAGLFLWRPAPPPRARPELTAHGLTVALDTTSAVLTLTDAAHTWQRDLVLSAVLDGTAEPILLDERDAKTSRGTLAVGATLEVDGAPVRATLSCAIQPDGDALVATLSLADTTKEHDHALALRAGTATGGRSAFLSGTGEIGDLGKNHGRFVLVDTEHLTLGFASAHGDIDVAAVVDDPDDVGTPMRLAITGFPESTTGRVATDLRVAVGPSARVVGVTYRLAGEHTLHVRGVITGTSKPARVFGLDAAGVPLVRFDAEPDDHFAVAVPTAVAQWYATLGSSLTSPPVRYAPGTPADLRLDVAPGGTLRVRVTDPDTKRPLTARILVRGEGETLDPSFGPDYRASGAGPIIDSLHGNVETPLPEGHYRVAATKGIEWSIDAASVVVESGHTVEVDLHPRHVIPNDGLVGCDLHVHARPSFDTPVSAEDRVLSLVAAGIDFAVPTEHNIVGDYAPAIATLGLTGGLSTVTGVEVTTYSPRFGHFGVFPYPKGPVPPFKGTTAAQVFAAAHKDPSRILQVNHPRLAKGIGYFDVMRFDPAAPHPPAKMRTDFDTIEVYNGFDDNEPARVDAVLRDWFALLNQGFRYVATGSSDSHRIQYQWAGYPRTMVTVPVTAAVEALGTDPLAVVSSIKKGHVFVTSGPMLELEVAGAHPGDEAPAMDGHVEARITLRAAPWVDVRSLDIVVAGRVVRTLSVPPRPTVTGPEPGTLAEAQLRTIRLEETVTVDVGATDNWMLVVARGTRTMEDVLPYMPIPPMGFTNPIWLIHDPAAFFGPPRPRKPR